MSFVYGGINTDDLEGVSVSAPDYPNMGGLTLDTVETPGRDGRYYGGSRMTTSVLSFRVTVRGENQIQADQRRLDFLRILDPSLGPRSLRLDNTQNWHYPQAVVSEQIEWEKHIDRSKVIYDGTVTFETNFDPAMRQIDQSSVTGTGRVEFIADMGSTVSYPTVIFESGGDLRVRVNGFTVDLRNTPPDTYGVLNWDEFKFYTADADVAQSIFYEWEDVPYNSPSVKLVGGEIVSRNLVHDSGFENGLDGVSHSNGIASPVRTQNENLVHSGQWAMRTRGNGESTGLQYIYKNITGLSGGDWIAAAAYAYPTAGAAGQVRLRAGFGGGGSRQFVDLTPYIDARGGWHRLSGAAQVPAGYTSAWLMVYVSDWNRTSLSENAWFSHDDWHFATADTEQDALAQVEHYFDGDTVGHIVPGERISSLVNNMEHYERPAIYPGQRVEVEVTPIGSNTATPVIIYPNHRRL